MSETTDLADLVEAWRITCADAEQAIRQERVASGAHTTAVNELNRARSAEREAFGALENYRRTQRLAEPERRPTRTTTTSLPAFEADDA